MFPSSPSSRPSDGASAPSTGEFPFPAATDQQFLRSAHLMRTLALAGLAMVAGCRCPEKGEDTGSAAVVDTSTPACNVDQDGDGYTQDGGDCDDADSTIHPGAKDRPYDGVNSNCDDRSDYDGDQDGVVSALFGGTDCNDSNPNITSPNACDEVFNMGYQYGTVGPVTDAIYNRGEILYVGTGLNGQTTPNSICQLAGYDQAQFARGFGSWPICGSVDVSFDAVDPDTFVFPNIENMHDCEGNNLGGSQGKAFIDDINASYGTDFDTLSSYGDYYRPTSTIAIDYQGALNEGLDGVAKCASLMPPESEEE